MDREKALQIIWDRCQHSKETEKQFREFDYNTALREVWNIIPNTATSISKIVNYQNELYGYISYVDESLINTAVVLDVNTKYSTFKAQLYCIENGHIANVKLKRKLYEQMPIVTGSMIKFKFETKPGWKKDEREQWQLDYSKQDTWLSYYTIAK